MSNWVTFAPLLARKQSKIDKIPDLPVSTIFGQKGIKYYPIRILRPVLESSHQGVSFRPQNERKLITLFFSPHGRHRRADRGGGRVPRVPRLKIVGERQLPEIAIFIFIELTKDLDFSGFSK